MYTRYVLLCKKQSWNQGGSFGVPVEWKYCQISVDWFITVVPGNRPRSQGKNESSQGKRPSTPPSR